MSMTFDDYMEEMKPLCEDAIDSWVSDDNNSKDFGDMLCELTNQTTGNSDGSFTMNREKAKENLQGIIFANDERLMAQLRNMGIDHIPAEREAEEVDVLVRICAVEELASDLREYFDKAKEKN